MVLFDLKFDRISTERKDSASELLPVELFTGLFAKVETLITQK